MSRLSMIKRFSKEFNDLNVTKCLYVSLVRSILEFASVVWNPFYDCYKNKIESIQRQFLLFALKSLNWSNRFQLPPYLHRLLLLELNTFEDRRKMLNVIFIDKLLNGKIDCFDILSLLNVHVPQKYTRNFKCFNVNFSKSNY